MSEPLTWYRVFEHLHLMQRDWEPVGLGGGWPTTGDRDEAQEIRIRIRKREVKR